ASCDGFGSFKLYHALILRQRGHIGLDDRFADPLLWRASAARRSWYPSQGSIAGMVRGLAGSRPLTCASCTGAACEFGAADPSDAAAKPPKDQPLIPKTPSSTGAEAKAYSPPQASMVRRAPCTACLADGMRVPIKERWPSG